MRLSRFQLAGALAAFAAVAALAVFLIWPSMLLTDEGVVTWPSPAKTPAAAQRLAMQASASADAASSASGDALPAMGFRHMANAIGQERDLYAWFHRMLKQKPPSAAQVSLMQWVAVGCREANSAIESGAAGSLTELFEELKFRCSGFTREELDRNEPMIAYYAGQVSKAAYEAYGQKRCEDVWRIEQQYGWLPDLAAGCLFPHVDGRVSTLFGSQHQSARNYAFYLELSIAEWGARDGMAPSQMHTMQLVLCAQAGYACGTPSEQLAWIQYISEVGDTFPLSEIDRMRPLIRDYLRHPDLSIAGTAPEQPKVWRKPPKPWPKMP